VAQPETVHDTRTGIAFSLAFVAGFVDVIGWLALDELYTSHLTGNTARIGIELAAGHGGEAFTRAVPVMAFVVGVGAGALLAEVLVLRGVRSAIAPGLAIEAALIGAFLLWAWSTAHLGVIPLEPRWAFDLQTALLALAMGVQTATFRRVDGATVRTTYITGMLTHFAEELADRVANRHDAPSDEGFARRTLTVGGIWPCFLAGAVAGAFGHTRWGTGALLVPFAALAALVVCDLVWPARGPKGTAGERRTQRRTSRE